MNRFDCSCGLLYVGLSDEMECPDCGETNVTSEHYIHSPETACHQLGVPYSGEQVREEIGGPPKLALSTREYEAWDLDKRCFWAGCGGCMKVNENGVGCCFMCLGEVRVFSIDS